MDFQRAMSAICKFCGIAAMLYSRSTGDKRRTAVDTVS